MTSKGCAFLMDMGTGKTITTIALAGTLHHRHKITQMLVVCPKSIVDVWEQEFEKFADFPYQLAVLDGTSAKKADTIRYMIGNGLQIIVLSMRCNTSGSSRISESACTSKVRTLTR